MNESGDRCEIGNEACAASPGELKPEKPIRLGLISSDPLRLVGLQALLEPRPELEVVELAYPYAGKIDGLAMVLIDSSVTAHLLELLAAFRRDRPKLNLIVLGPDAELERIEQIIGAGAKGYLSHTAGQGELLMAIDVVGDGSVWAPRKVLARLLERAQEGGAAEGDALMPTFTPRERDVLHLLAQGQPNREIAQALGVDEGAVKAHVGRLMRKLGVGNRTALTMRAIDRALT